ncbi:MAG: C39 family peptidase [Nitrospirota bacterium]|nr:C39 family peptidase [Nitrospirota bacterium]
MTCLARTWATAILLALFTVGLCRPSPASANISFVGTDTYEVGIPRDYVLTWAHPKDMGRQIESHWCWAASVQMVLNMAHVPVTQEEIVRRTFGRKENLPATALQMMTALDGWSSSYRGKRVVVRAFVEPSFDQILLDLYLNYPVILILKFGSQTGHAVVITAARYKISGGKKQILYFLIRDPWPKNPSSEILESRLFKGIKGAIGIRILLKKAE